MKLPSATIPMLAYLTFLLAAGCASYHVGPKAMYPPDVRTVYVPMFESDSLRRHLGERLTEAVMKEIEMRTDYKVVGDANADSVLSGRIVEDRKRVLVENRFDDVRELETSLLVEVRWVKRGGQFIAQNSLVPVDPSLVALVGAESVVPEVGQSVATGHQEAIQRVARQIVDMMEMPW